MAGRGLPPDGVHRALRPAGSMRRRAASSCSTRRSRRGGGPAFRPECGLASCRVGCVCGSSTPTRWRPRLHKTYQHHHADLLLRHISGILPVRDAALAAIKQAVDKTYGKKSKRLADLNHKAIDLDPGRFAGTGDPRPPRRRRSGCRCCRGGRWCRTSFATHLAGVPGEGDQPARVGDAAGRQLHDRYRPLRETQHRPGDSGVGG